MVRSRTIIAIPPGATIKEQLDNRGMSQKEFAARMEMSEKHISHLINGDVQLTPDVAMRLELVLGLPAHFWSNLESIYREKLLRIKAENEMDEDKETVKNLPYNEMAKNGWVPSTRNSIERVYHMRKFFEVVRLGKLDAAFMPKIAARKLGNGEKSDYALLAWAQRAKTEARTVSTAPINFERLKSIIPGLCEMTMQDPAVFCPKLCHELANCGIALVFLPHIGGSFLHGATFLDGTKIVIGMTVRGKDADKFWFSLFHELGHIILGHIGQRGETTAEDEDAANVFARNALIADNEFNAFTNRMMFDRQSIIAFAKRMGIDVGIVVGRLQKEGYIAFSDYQDLKTKYMLTDSE